MAGAGQEHEEEARKMSAVAKRRSFGVFLVTLCLSLTTLAQCPMGMETHYHPSDFHTLAGHGICHLRLWDSKTAWIDLETGHGHYNWAKLDSMLSEANRLGADVLYTFGKVPEWATSNPNDPNCRDHYGHGDCAPPKDVDKGDAYFKGLVTALVQHVGTRITYYEMWNEPYNPPYWDGTPEQLAIMVSDAAQIIRSLNPQAVILTTSMSPWSNQQVFLQNFLSACRGKVSFDIFAMHDYTWGGPPESVVKEIQSVRKFQAMMGMQNLPLWGTEGSDIKWAGFTPQQRLDFVARYYTLELNHGSERHYWYSWDDRNLGGLMGNPGAKVYATVGSWFANRKPLGCVRTGNNPSYRFVCTLQDTTSHPIVWVTNGTGTFTTTASSYQTTDGVIHAVVGGSVPIDGSPIFILQ
jgi:hypothetical protein